MLAAQALGHAADAAQAVGDDLDRLLGCRVAEHLAMLFIEVGAQGGEIAGSERGLAGKRQLIALPGIAHVQCIFDLRLARFEMLFGEFLVGAALEFGEDGVDFGFAHLREGGQARADIVVLDVRHHETHGGIDAGVEGHDDARHAEVGGDAAGMQGAGTAECQQHEVAQVVTTHGGNRLDGFLHLHVDDAHNAFRRILDAHAERLCDRIFDRIA